MFRATLVASLVLTGTPALAQGQPDGQPNDTMKAMIARGAVLTIGGSDVEISFETGEGGNNYGPVWMADTEYGWYVSREKLCMEIAGTNCLIVPAGRGAGARFAARVFTNGIEEEPIIVKIN